MITVVLAAVAIKVNSTKNARGRSAVRAMFDLLAARRHERERRLF
jgi:hypothetical protein